MRVCPEQYSTPLVSVIIPSYNAAKYVGYALQSVLQQTVTNIEVIVVDDCSTDNTRETILNFEDHRLRYYANAENMGPSFSRNRGIGMARGEWIAILDADDWWDLNRLERLIDEAQHHDADIVCDDLWMIRDGHPEPYDTYLRSRRSIIGEIASITKISPVKMIKDDYGFLQPLIKRSFLVQSGITYRTDVKFGEDFLYVLECLTNHAAMFIVPHPMYYYRQRETSLSRDSMQSFEVQIRTLFGVINELKVSRASRTIRRELRYYVRRKQSYLLEFRILGMMDRGQRLSAVIRLVIHPFILGRLVKRKIHAEIV